MLEPDVIIGIAHGGSVTWQTTSSLLALQRWDLDHDRHVGMVTGAGGPLLDNNRNALARKLIATPEARWLLLLDTDIVFPPDLLDRLLAKAAVVEREAGEAYILAGFYRTRRQVRESVTLGADGQPAPTDVIVSTWCIPAEGEEPLGRNLTDCEPSPEPIELTSCGLGCTLIERSVVEELWTRHVDDGAPVFSRERHVMPGGARVRLGEDVSFCLRARWAGYRVWGCPDIRCGHVKSMVVR